MLVFEIPKEDHDLIEKVTATFKNYEITDVNSLDAETISQVIVPTIQAALPVASAIIVALISASRKVKVKWNNIEISGTEKQVEKFLEKIVALESEQNNKKNTKKGK